MRSITETQFVYAYLKNRTEINNTVYETGVNKSKDDEKCLDNTTNTGDNYIQGLATDWTWYITLVIYGIGLPVLVLIGPLSDKLGRKPIILYNLGLTVISFSIRTYIVYADLNLYWYLLTCCIEGFAGSHYAYHFACCSTLANCTKAGKQRPFAFALYESMMGLGLCISEIGTGYLIKLLGFTYPYLISNGLNIIVFISFCTFQEENIEIEKTHTFSAKTKEVYTFCTKRESLSRSVSWKIFSITILIFFIYHFPISSFGSIRTLYTLGLPFCWSSVHIGWYAAGVDVIQYVFSVLILRCLLMVIKDETITILGFVSNIAFLVMFGMLAADWFIYTATAIGVIRILPNPLLKSFLSRMVIPDKQGTLFSNIYLIEATCRLGGVTVFNNIYHQTRPIFKGMVFIVMASFSMCAVVLFICTQRTRTQTEHQEIAVDEPTVQSQKDVNEAQNNECKATQKD
ncbi:proton-coupled folate transporter-like [Mytilus galloprovincialis]|uniref:proton-coupled folate transporter-like n=1 Tax=Mytilus galloprovincialis TaxID=29158 RepID=UPI003F7B5EB0